MHYHAEVWIEENNNVVRKVQKILSPFREDFDADTDEITGLWDWYQIGGRWTGVHSPNYSPEDDPRNKETCRLCQGTGIRDGRECNGCRHSKPLGIRTKWPTEWAAFDGDVMEIANVPEDLTCYALFINETVYCGEEKGAGIDNNFDGEIKKKLAELGVDGGFLVTVDMHS